MLVDQKMNDGIAVPFLGRPAMTAPAVARFALKYRCPVIPARVQRVKGAHFRMTFYPPLDLPNSGDVKADTLAMMTAVNDLIGSWIREAPGQWLWLHRRWPE
jgi:KDO2-lipid IV(A) lauroyltransferase